MCRQFRPMLSDPVEIMDTTANPTLLPVDGGEHVDDCLAVAEHASLGLFRIGLSSQVILQCCDTHLDTCNVNELCRLSAFEVRTLGFKRFGSCAATVFPSLRDTESYPWQEGLGTGKPAWRNGNDKLPI